MIKTTPLVLAGIAAAAAVAALISGMFLDNAVVRGGDITRWDRPAVNGQK